MQRGRIDLAIPDDPTVLNAYIDNTYAYYTHHALYPHSTDIAWSLCVREGDNALYYHSSVYVSMPPQDQILDGVLAR